MQTRKNGIDRFNDKDTQTSCMWNGAETQIHHGARGDPGLMGRLDQIEHAVEASEGAAS